MDAVTSIVSSSFDITDSKSMTELKLSQEIKCLSPAQVSENIAAESVNNINKNENFNSESVNKFSYVTVDEINASLSKKEENDSLSLSGSCISQSISQISTITRGSSFDDLSLNALRVRKNELINSIQNHLNMSKESNEICNDVNISNSTIILPQDEKDLVCSTPLRETVPLAAKFLKEWKPSFASNDKPNEETKTIKYEEAFASLHEILSSTSTDSILELYSSKLDAYKEEDNKKFDEIFNQIDSDKKNFFDVDFDEEICKKITDISDDTLILRNTIIEFDDNENTVVCMKNEDENNSVQSESKEKGLINKQVEKKDTIPNTPVEKVQETVITTYEDKDPENLIIGEGNVAGYEILDEDLLLASDNEEENIIIPTSAVTGFSKELEEFVSNDPEENRDNNDPKWNYLRNLGNDYERYKAVRARWKNFEIPNPKKDLTCRCRRTTQNIKISLNEKYQKNRFGKRSYSPEIERRCFKKPRRESCTMLFDLSIRTLINNVEHERRQIEMQQEESLNHLADIQNMDQIMAQKKCATDIYIRQMKRRHFIDTENLIKEFRRKLDDLMGSARQKIDALRKAADEVRQFHEFYPNEDSKNEKNSLVFLTETEVQEILEVEDMLIRFETFYNTPPTV